MISKVLDSYLTTIKVLAPKMLDGSSNLGKKLIARLVVLPSFMFGGLVVPRHSVMAAHTINHWGSGQLSDYQKRMEMSILFLILILMAVGTFLAYQFTAIVEKNNRKYRFINKLANGEFLLYYQPIVNPDQKKVMACEALLRMKDNDKILSPFHFLETIEELGLMEQVTLWVLKRVIKDYQEIKTHNSNLDDDFYISLNVSFKEIGSSSFIEQVKEILSQIDLTQIKLCFEIVEKYHLEDEVLTNKVIQDLRSLGIKVAIDDFGVEYANLDMLDKIDYDIIKLDKHFIDEIQTSFIRQESVIFIGKVIEYYQKRMVMEGLEYPKQLEVLQELYPGVVYIQGYLYSPPISLEEMKIFTLQLTEDKF